MSWSVSGFGTGSVAAAGTSDPVRGTPAARLVDDFVEAGLALGDRHLPLGRGGLDEHDARRCAGLTEGVEEVADGLRSVGVLVAIPRVADALFDLDARPVGIELVGGDHRERGADAGPHLRAVRHDMHRAVGIDAEVDARMERRRRRPCVRNDAVCASRESGTKRAATTNAPAEKTPPRKCRRLTFAVTMV